MRQSLSIKNKNFYRSALNINESLKIILIVVTILLLIPFIAMQFTDKVSWTILDFVVMGILLLGTGILCELAVGIFGMPLAGNYKSETTHNN